MAGDGPLVDGNDRDLGDHFNPGDHLLIVAGMNAIARIGSLGGIFTIAVNIIFIVVSFTVLFANHFQLAEPIHGLKTFITSPNPQFQTPIAIVSFVVYAIFAYGGMESLGSVTDSMDNPQKTFPRGLIIASVFTIGAYVLMIFMVGWSVNYHDNLGTNATNLGNVTYAIFNDIGVEMGTALGWSHAAALGFGGNDDPDRGDRSDGRLLRCPVYPNVLAN